MEQPLLSIDFFAHDDNRRIAHALLPRSALTLEVLSEILIREQSQPQDHRVLYEWRDEDDYFNTIDNEEELRTAIEEQTKGRSSSLRFFVTATPHHHPNLTRKRDKEDVDADLSSSSSAQGSGEKRQRTDETPTKPLVELSEEQVVHLFEELEQPVAWIDAARERGLTGRMLSTVETGEDLRAHELTQGRLERIGHEKALLRDLRGMREKGVSVRYLPPPPPISPPPSSPLPSGGNKAQSKAQSRPDDVDAPRLQAMLDNLQTQIDAQATTNQSMFNRIFEMHKSMEMRFEKQLTDLLQAIQATQKKMETPAVPDEQNTMELVRELQRSQKQLKARIEEETERALRERQSLEERFKHHIASREKGMNKSIEELQKTHEAMEEHVNKQLKDLLSGMEQIQDIMGAHVAPKGEEKTKPEEKKQISKTQSKATPHAAKNEIPIEIKDVESIRNEEAERERADKTLSVIRHWCAEAEKHKVSPLYLACERRNMEGLENLLKCTVRMLENESISVKENIKGSVEEWLSKAEETKNDWTPLHVAAYHGEVDFISLLAAKRNSNKDAKDKDQRTPMHIAAARGHKDAMYNLITHKANLDAEDTK